MIPYHKINSPWKRDPETKQFLRDQWARPEFALLKDCQWRADEKVDGTNIRITWSPELSNGPIFGGRTDKAQIPAELVRYLQNTFTQAAMMQAFPELENATVILFGEGYGAGIQKGGGSYVEGFQNKEWPQQFALFDVMIVGKDTKPIWLMRTAVEDIAATLGIAWVPVQHQSLTLLEAIHKIEHGEPQRSFMPGTSKEKIIEGFVLRPVIELQDRMGRRIITKIKYKDFKRG